jgi:Predicted nucleotidyltransferases
MPELYNRYEVGALGVFGSYLRGEADEKSDLLGLKIDPMEMPIFKPALGRRILEDVVPVHRDHYYEYNEYSDRRRPGRKITGPHA